MEKKDAEKEIKYQLIKLLLLKMQRQELITAEEAETVRKKAQDRLKPIIGSLD